MCLNQLRLDFHPQRPVDVSFLGPQLSSDGGLVLIRSVDDSLQLSQRIARFIPDHRNPLFTIHSRWEQTRQRLFQIAQGYQDCNDADSLRHDPCFQMVCDLLPDDSLSSQPTLCRFENALDYVALRQLEDLMMDLFVEDQHPATMSMTIDIDGTMLETHGQHQQLALFHGYYEVVGYYPLTVWDDQGRLACAMLRSGKGPDSVDALPCQAPKAWPATFVSRRLGFHD